MRTIWKFELPFEERFDIKMPSGAEILTLQLDEKTSHPCIWAVVDTDYVHETRSFRLLTTGAEVPNGINVKEHYIGSYQYQKGEFIGHVFEVF